MKLKQLDRLTKKAERLTERTGQAHAILDEILSLEFKSL